MLEFLKAPSLFLQVSYYTLMTFPDDAFCNIAICVDYTTRALSWIRYVICGDN